jgi:hypothetical protein
MTPLGAPLSSDERKDEEYCHPFHQHRFREGLLRGIQNYPIKVASQKSRSESVVIDGTRAYPDKEEGILAERIRTEFLEHGLLFADADFRLMAIEQHSLCHPVDPSAEQADFKQFMG